MPPADGVADLQALPAAPFVAHPPEPDQQLRVHAGVRLLPTRVRYLGTLDGLDGSGTWSFGGGHLPTLMIGVWVCEEANSRTPTPRGRKPLPTVTVGLTDSRMAGVWPENRHRGTPYVQEESPDAGSTDMPSWAAGSSSDASGPIPSACRSDPFNRIATARPRASAPSPANTTNAGDLA